MAAAPAVYYVSVQEYNDPSEPRPKDDQAIVFEARKDVPIKDYIEELNKTINDPKSFLYGSRISNERICVVLATVEQATFLVEQVGKIVVNNEIIVLKYFVAKAVKIIISNAMHDISNSTLKKYLTKSCGIRTFSSVSEFKTNMGPEKNDTWSMKSFRRFVYIHPDDVAKLPIGPVKFVTPQAPHNVFFELDIPKCFICGQTGHFRASCPNGSAELSKDTDAQIKNKNQELNLENSPSSSVTGVVEINVGAEDKVHKQQPAVDSPTSYSSLLSNPSKAKLSLDKLSPSHTYKLPSTPLKNNLAAPSQLENSLFSQEKENNEQQTFKRPHSPSYSEKSLNSDTLVNPNLAETNPVEKTASGVRKVKKKKCILGEKEFHERFISVSSGLESARPHIEASEVQTHMKFDKFSELVTKSSISEPAERKNIARSYNNDTCVLLKLIVEVHGLVSGKSTRKKLTALRKAIESNSSEISEDSVSDTSIVSD